MPNFKDEHILIIAPGSQYTHAQLGLPESFTPARLRVRSRMFPADKQGQWEPNKIRRRVKKSSAPTTSLPKEDGSTGSTENTVKDEHAHDEATLEEDPESDVGATWPIECGRVTNWPCFFALMEHVYNSLGGSFHMPIMLIAQPAWTPADHTRITKFFFERFKCPALALMDSAQAACYAYGIQTACVIDIGKEKADVTAIAEFVTQEQARAIAVSHAGGEAMTQHLLEQLKDEGFSRDMCEQLKLSSICEVLPEDVPMPAQQKRTVSDAKPNSNAAASADGTTKDENKARAGQDTENRTEQGAPTADENDGVIDVANIVTSGKMNEIIERKEQERQEKQSSRKKGANAAEPPKPVKLKNSEKEYNTFLYYDHSARDASRDAAANGDEVQDSHIGGQSNTQISANGANSQPTTSPVDAETTSPQLTSPTNPSFAIPSSRKDPHQRSLTVGIARFSPLPPDLLPVLTSTIRRVIEAVPNASYRQPLWDNLIITGNGSRIRGFREALLHALTSRYTVSPNSATMFTSEIPSNFSTPGGTGANTPQPQAVMPHYNGGQLNMGANRNSLLHAATTASASQLARPPNGLPPHIPGQQHLTPGPQYAGGNPMQSQYLAANGGFASPGQRPQFGGSSGSHSQTPTSVKTAKLPEYFPEWKEPGAEAEAVFLGAQVASKVFFLIDPHGGHQKGYMSRSDYNETGPQGIVDFVL